MSKLWPNVKTRNHTRHCSRNTEIATVETYAEVEHLNKTVSSLYDICDNEVEPRLYKIEKFLDKITNYMKYGTFFVSIATIGYTWWQWYKYNEKKETHNKFHLELEGARVHLYNVSDSIREIKEAIHIFLQEQIEQKKQKEEESKEEQEEEKEEEEQKFELIEDSDKKLKQSLNETINERLKPIFQEILKKNKVDNEDCIYVNKVLGNIIKNELDRIIQDS